jgi:hypothetical protein
VTYPGKVPYPRNKPVMGQCKKTSLHSFQLSFIVSTLKHNTIK